MPSAKITAELTKFTGDLEKNTSPTARFIIATNYCCSVGLTLTQAVNVTFLEPDLRSDIMDQGWSRHCRQGSKFEVVYCGLLLAEDNVVETRIMESNRMKKSLNMALERKGSSSSRHKSKTTERTASSWPDDNVPVVIDSSDQDNNNQNSWDEDEDEDEI